MPTVTRERGDYPNLDVLIDRLEALEGLSSKIGWFESAKYDEGTPVAAVAVQNEFGNPQQNIPPRPFMRPTIATNENSWKRYLQESSIDVINGTKTPAVIMEEVSALAAGQIRDSISDLHAPTLSPVTIRLRLKALGKDFSQEKISDYQSDNHTITKPLVFTGLLLNTITYIVEGEAEVMPYGGQPDVVHFRGGS